MPWINPIIGFENLLDPANGGVLADDPVGNPALPANPILNATDWLDFDFWKATNPAADAGFSVTFGAPWAADYFAVAAHDLFTQGASIVLQYWTGAWTNAFAPIVPTDNGVIFQTFSPQSSTIWRVLVSGAPTAAVSLGVVSFGNQLSIPAPVGIGFTPPNMAHADKILNNRADGGAFLGRSVIGKGIDLGKVAFDLLDPAWVRANWIPLMNHAILKPFFIQWNNTAFPAESAFVWTRGPIDKPQYSQPLLMRVALDMVGRRD